MELLADKDVAVRLTIRVRIFIHGYVIWNSCELDYRMKDVYDATAASQLGVAGWEEVP
jgi:hypothetical protein